jgi:hypothetical protein
MLIMIVMLPGIRGGGTIPHRLHWVGGGLYVVVMLLWWLICAGWLGLAAISYPESQNLLLSILGMWMMIVMIMHGTLSSWGTGGI